MTDVLPSRCSSAPEAPSLRCRPVRGAAELAAHHAIRRAVFVTEQALFTDDRDDRDDDPATVHLLGFVAGRPAGAVRLYPLDRDPLDRDPLGRDPLGRDTWKGDRLAVLPAQRRSGIGGPLVSLAVSSAGQRGGSHMVASVQAVNTAFFVSLGWAPVGGPFDLLGLPHQQMTIPLGLSRAGV